MTHAAERSCTRALAFLRALVSAGRDGEGAVLECVESELNRLGGTVERIAYDPAAVPLLDEFAFGTTIVPGIRTALVARFPGRGDGRSLLAFAHPDSEPVAGLDLWEHAPFDGSVVNGRLYGWGVADDLAGVAVMIAVADFLAEAGLQLAGDLVLAATPSKRNARGIAALLHRGFVADAALYLHPAESGRGLGEIKAFTAGQLEFSIVVDGAAPATTEPHQTGFAHRGVNAAEKALAVVAALGSLDLARAERIRHPVLEDAIGRSTNLMVSHLACGNVGRLSRQPDRCVIGAAVSFPPTEPIGAVQADIQAALTEACAADPWLAAHPPHVTWHAGVSGAEIGTDCPFYREAADIVTFVTGLAPRINPMHTGSDIRNPIVQKGIPTIGLGPLCGSLTQNGHHDEWVDVAEFGHAVMIATHLAASWCGVVARDETQADT